MAELRFAAVSELYKLRSGTKWVFNPASIDRMPLSVRLHAARGDRAAFQVILSSDTPWALCVNGDPWFTQRAPRVNVRVCADALPFDAVCNIVDMHTDDDGYIMSDALLSTPVVEERANETRLVYVQMSIPEDTPRGVYKGKIRFYTQSMFEEEQSAGEMSVTVETYDYRMPDIYDNNFYLDLWQHNSILARQYELALWSDEHFAVMDRYIAALAALGQRAVTLVVSEVPWSGQSCYMDDRNACHMFEQSIVPVQKDMFGRFSYDFSIMQRYIDLCAKHGIKDELSIYGLCNVWKNEAYGFGRIAADYPDNLRVRYFDAYDSSYKYMTDARDIDGYIRALEQYFISSAQIERVRVAADEPGDIESYRRSLSHIRELAPAFRFKAALNHAEFIGEFGDEVDDFVPSMFSLCEEYDKLMSYKRTLSGKRFLWYICCDPAYPNNFLRSDLMESVFLGLFTSYARMDGFLRWSFYTWNDDPRGDIRFGNWKAGDLCIVYPGKDGGVLLSLRYMALRRAIELYGMLEALRARGLESELAGAYKMILKEGDITKYFREDLSLRDIQSLDSGDYEQLKCMLLETLSK